MRDRRWSGVWLLAGAAAGWAAGSVAWQGVALLRTAAGVGGAAASGDPGAVLTALAELALCAVLGRVAACAGAVSLALALPRRSTQGSAPRRSERVAIALSPRLVRPVVALSLSAGAALLSTGTAMASPLATVSTSTSHPAAHASRDAGPAIPAFPDAGWGPSASPGDSAHLPAAGWSAPPPRSDARRPADVALVSPEARRHRAPGPSGDPARQGLDPSADAVVVRRGDSLWSLAARQLGPGTTDARIATQWQRWWRANRATIGSDPDVLVPGTVLLAPVFGEVAG